MNEKDFVIRKQSFIFIAKNTGIALTITHKYLLSKSNTSSRSILLVVVAYIFSQTYYLLFPLSISIKLASSLSPHTINSTSISTCRTKSRSLRPLKFAGPFSP